MLSFLDRVLRTFRLRRLSRWTLEDVEADLIGEAFWLEKKRSKRKHLKRIYS